MLSIRLKRFGKKKMPTYRVVVMDKRKSTKSNYKELLGFYDPRSKPKTIKLNKERINYWLGVGAMPSPTLRNLFVDAGIVKGPKTKVSAKKKIKEGPKTPAAAEESKEKPTA
jgi:small subunit ribosomal protein S16